MAKASLSFVFEAPTINGGVNVFQIMQNHVHGVIQIKEKTRRGVQLNARTGDRFSKISPRKGTLGVIIRTFKASVMTELRKVGRYPAGSIWQRGFYDHIHPVSYWFMNAKSSQCRNEYLTGSIRDDINHFFVEQYIALNPIMWNLDKDNPRARQMPADLLRKTLQDEHGLNGMALGRMIEYELSYREWSWRREASQ